MKATIPARLLKHLSLLWNVGKDWRTFACSWLLIRSCWHWRWKMYKRKVDSQLKCVARYWMEQTPIFIQQHYMGVAWFDDTLNIFCFCRAIQIFGLVQYFLCTLKLCCVESWKKSLDVLATVTTGKIGNDWMIIWILYSFKFSIEMSLLSWFWLHCFGWASGFAVFGLHADR